MTIDDVFAFTGATADRVVTQPIGAYLTSYHWHEPMDGRDGWWWVVAAEGVVFALGWTSGDNLARDMELGRAIAAASRRTRASLRIVPEDQLS